MVLRLCKQDADDGATGVDAEGLSASAGNCARAGSIKDGEGAICGALEAVINTVRIGKESDDGSACIDPHRESSRKRTSAYSRRVECGERSVARTHKTMSELVYVEKFSRDHASVVDAEGNCNRTTGDVEGGEGAILSASVAVCHQLLI